MGCPLCGSTGCEAFHRDRRRHYLRCPECLLVFVPPVWFLSPEAERAEYELHENDPADSGYRKFLARLAEPLAARLAPGARGLDFGCGPGPALAAMLREYGFAVSLYDPFFYPEKHALARTYHFITATEVVEHMHRPGRDLALLWGLLEEGGWLAVMTKLVRDREAFRHWHYKNDPTHVAFFSKATWSWWAHRHDAALDIIGSDVILLQRGPRSSGRYR